MTAEHKHTEGPWEYIAGNEHHGPYVMSYAGDVADCYTMSNLNAASVRNGGDSYPVPFCGEQADANARLIAAAPEMLAALKMVLGKMDDWNQDGPTIQAIKATIAKAEG